MGAQGKSFDAAAITGTYAKTWVSRGLAQIDPSSRPAESTQELEAMQPTPSTSEEPAQQAQQQQAQQPARSVAKEGASTAGTAQPAQPADPAAIDWDELRIDPSDGKPYSRASFYHHYRADDYMAVWERAQPAVQPAPPPLPEEPATMPQPPPGKHWCAEAKHGLCKPGS